jgi:hypothetical protein
LNERSWNSAYVDVELDVDDEDLSLLLDLVSLFLESLFDSVKDDGDFASPSLFDSVEDDGDFAPLPLFDSPLVCPLRA